MFNLQALTGFSFVLMRMTGCILFNPILGRRNFPALFRAGIILLLSITVFSYTGVQVDVSTRVVPLAVALLSELAIGFVAGFIVNLFAYIVVLGGSFIDYEMGLSMANIYDPQSNISMSLSSTFYNIMFLFLFFAVNGHLALIHLFLSLGELIPYGQPAFRPELAEAILDVFCRCTVLGITMAMPMIAIELLLEIAVGILMKAIPQINVFAVNLQAKLLAGLLVMLIAFSPVSEFIQNAIVEMFETVRDIMALMQ